MKNLRLFLSALCIIISTAYLYGQAVNFTVIINPSPAPISPYIYGANPEFTPDENLGARRLGGNRMTGYNWENNASHAGTDWYNNNDGYMEPASPNQNTPGGTLTAFQNEALSVGAYSAITLQMAGYVAKDKNGTSVSAAEVAPSSRFVKVQFVKGSAFSLTPSLTDTSVFMDECVNKLVNTFGMANTSNGVKAYILDNEPALWPSTHPRIHPNAPTCTEVKQNGIALANAVKNVDPYAEIFGPALYGFAAYTDFQGASDWSTVSSGKGYDWFIDYYLDEMKKGETTYGKRLLNVLDVHWYPEAYGNGSGGKRITDTSANSANERAARIHAPRTLWDSHYGYSTTDAAVGENSWIAQWGSAHLPLIPKLMASINKYYPGTKLSFTEFTYGGERDITGGIATADVLGIFGKYGVYFASFWPGNNNTSYVQAAYRMYRNYDGSKSTFGDASTPARTSDSVNTSIYSSVKTGTNEIHVIAINKNLTASRTANFTIQIDGSVLSGNVWVLTGSGATITNAGSIGAVTNNAFSYSLPAGSVSHFVLITSNSAVITDGNENQPSRFQLYTYPNPFNPSCNIDFVLPDNTPHDLMIIDVMGRKVKTFSNLTGNGSVVWNGTNDNNQTVASGTYVVTISKLNRYFLSKKIVMVK